MLSLDIRAVCDFYPLNQLSSKGLEALSSGMKIRTYSRGHQLFKIGDTPLDLFYILQGQAVLTDEQGDTFMLVQPTQVGQITPLPNLSPSLHHAFAETDISVLMIDLALFNKVLSNNLPDIPQSEEIWYTESESRKDWKQAFLHASGFQRIAPETLREIFKRMYPLPVKKGEVIIRQGDLADNFYVIADGRCEVLRESENLGRSVKLTEYGVGACLGEDALISNNPRNATVRMLTNGCLMKLDGDDFRILVKTPMTRPVSYDAAKRMIKNGAQYIDVRMPEQVSSHKRLPESINIPHPILRARLFSADPKQSYIVVCAKGTDSAVIAFVMSKYNYDAYYLTGGFSSIPSEDLV